MGFKETMAEGKVIKGDYTFAQVHKAVVNVMKDMGEKSGKILGSEEESGIISLGLYKTGAQAVMHFSALDLLSKSPDLQAAVILDKDEKTVEVCIVNATTSQVKAGGFIPVAPKSVHGITTYRTFLEKFSVEIKRCKTQDDEKNIEENISDNSTLELIEPVEPAVIIDAQSIVPETPIASPSIPVSQAPVVEQQTPIPQTATPPVESVERLFCKKCGTKLKTPNSKFCSKCGSKIEPTVLSESAVGHHNVNNENINASNSNAQGNTSYAAQHQQASQFTPNTQNSSIGNGAVAVLGTMNKKLLIILGAVIVALIILLLFTVGPFGKENAKPRDSREDTGQSTRVESPSTSASEDSQAKGKATSIFKDYDGYALYAQPKVHGYYFFGFSEEGKVERIWVHHSDVDKNELIENVALWFVGSEDNATGTFVQSGDKVNFTLEEKGENGQVLDCFADILPSGIAYCGYSSVSKWDGEAGYMAYIGTIENGQVLYAPDFSVSSISDEYVADSEAQEGLNGLALRMIKEEFARGTEIRSFLYYTLRDLGFEDIYLEYAMEHLDVDWYAAAIQRAKDFEDLGEKEHIINQLTGDGFSEEEAEYGYSHMND